jgi:guanine deaminase
MSGAPIAVRGALITFDGDPFVDGPGAVRYERDAVVVMAEGLVQDVGPARAVLDRLPVGTPVTAYANALLSAGFVDAHVHYPQMPVIGAGGVALLDWLTRHTFPAETRHADVVHAREAANLYIAEALRNGVTTGAVYGTVHAHSVDVLFDAALARGMRVVAGKFII